MVFGACATRFINVCSTVQCGVYIVTGAQIKFVDRCQTRSYPSTIREKLVQRVLSAERCPHLYFVSWQGDSSAGPKRRIHVHVFV